VKAIRRAWLLGTLATLAACDAERVLAIARDATTHPTDAGGDATTHPTDAGGDANDAGQDASGLDAAPGDAGPSFGSPTLVPGLRSDTDDVEDPSLTFEETEIYFASPTSGQNDIWVSRRTLATDPWGPSTLVAELSGPQNDQDPEVSVDGLVMYFSSDRGGNGLRLYASTRRTRDTPWETPTRVDMLGTSALDAAPTLDRGQLHLVLASQRGTAAVAHLFAATRPDSSAAWPSAAEVTALSSGWEDTDPALFSDGRALLFASRRLTQGGATDLFEASRSDVNSPFASSLAPVSALNTSASEEDPWVSQDGRHIVFVSDRSGRKRIYEARR
jgi:hypothetical protein